MGLFIIGLVSFIIPGGFWIGVACWSLAALGLLDDWCEERAQARRDRELLERAELEARKDEVL